jgi:NAD:arginine ADP-ribosyltransferase
VQTADNRGRTPLLEATIGGHVSVVTLLLLHGADPKASLDGKSASELAGAMDQELALIVDAASRTDVVQVHRLVRWLASSPRYPSEAGDRLMVRMLLHEKGVDARVEPLATAILQEIRRDTGSPPSAAPGSPRSPHARRGSPAAISQSERQRRDTRFVGVPPESITIRPSWILGGTDASVLNDEVHSLEDMASTISVRDGDEWQVVSKANYTPIINRAVLELSHITTVDRTVTALDEFNRFFVHLGKTTPLSEIHRVLCSALMLYTSDSFYRVLNDCWRGGQSRALLGFSTLMSLAFRHARPYSGNEVYRGVNLADVEHYVPGLVFRWPFFVSASADPAIAAQFGGTVVAIEIPSGADARDISRFSPFRDEQEVLLPAYQVFEVLQADRDEIRLRVFHDPFFGTGWVRTAGGEVLPVE